MLGRRGRFLDQMNHFCCVYEMNIVTLKKKNICIIVICCFIAFSLYKKLRPIFEADEELVKRSSPFAFAAWISCTRNIAWFTKRNGDNEVASAFYRSIDILGPPGSGVEWLRYVIEQLTGLKTGSTLVAHPEIFAGEGHTTKVLAVMSHDIDNVSSQNAGIVMYRNIKDTVRTHFAETNGAGAFLEAPLHAYYGKEWMEFAVQEGRRWAARYKRYVERRYPVLIISYNELEDRRMIQSQLLRLSNFLRVPVRKSALQCIMQHASDFPLKPRPLKSGFQPFRLLLPKHVTELHALENETQRMIDGLRAVYRPNV